MPTEDVQRVLPHLLGAKLPDVVDSACLAGLLDLHRTRGLWCASTRYGYVFGFLRDARCARHYALWPRIPRPLTS